MNSSHEEKQIIQRIKLKDFFTLFPPTYILGTTYTISLTFFESFILPFINRQALKKCVILCDEFGFRRSIAEAGALAEISNSYMMMTPSSARTLHAKVWLMASQDKIALLVGSGNLTQSGFMQNLELFDVIQLSLPSVPKLLFEDIKSFLKGLEGHCSDLSQHYSLLNDFFSEINVLFKEFDNKIDSDEDTDVRFFSSFRGSFFDQLAQVVSNSDIYIASPYFGGSTEGFSLLYDAVKANSARVYPGIDKKDGTVNVPLHKIQSFPKTKVGTLKLAEGQAFSHLKLYGFRKKQEKECWLFNGSVNCTKAALSGENIEAGILRKVSAATLDSYFVEGKSIGSPIYKPSHYDDSEVKWISLVAANMGSQIELVASSTVECPLSHVDIILTSGPKRYLSSREKIFFHGLVEKLEWTRLGVEQHKSGSVFMLEFRAIDANGIIVKSACYVDDFFVLSSDPVNRSALRAANMLLSGDGPTSNDIAAIFQLIDPFRAGGFLDVHDVDKPGKATTGREKETHDTEKPPLWPPVLLTRDAGTWIHSHQLSQTYWLQRIMDQLFSPSDTETDEESENEKEIEDSEKNKGKSKTTKKNKENLWLKAQNSYDLLKDRLKPLVITERISQNLFPFSLTTFLILLASRKNYLKATENISEAKSIGLYVSDFLSTLFYDREQENGYIVPNGCRYKHKIFPPISNDVHDHFHVKFPQDLCSIIFVLFLYLKALVSRGHQTAFPVLSWLRFCELSGESLDNIYSESFRMEAVYRRYLTDDEYSLAWSDMERFIPDLLKMNWYDFDGYSDLVLLMNSLKSGMKAPPLKSQHLGTSLDKFYHRVEMKMEPLFYEADRFADYCIIKNCSKAFVSDPAKKRLLSLNPVICEGCGTLLIPDELYQNIMRHKVND